MSIAIIVEDNLSYNKNGSIKTDTLQYLSKISNTLFFRFAFPQEK